MEEPIADLPDELLQLRPGGVDQQRARLAEDGSLHPQLGADGGSGPQGAHEAERPSQAEEDFLLRGGHGAARAALSAGGCRGAHRREAPAACAPPHPPAALTEPRTDCGAMRSVLGVT